MLFVWWYWPCLLHQKHVQPISPLTYSQTSNTVSYQCRASLLTPQLTSSSKYSITIPWWTHPRASRLPNYSSKHFLLQYNLCWPKMALTSGSGYSQRKQGGGRYFFILSRISDGSLAWKTASTMARVLNQILLLQEQIVPLTWSTQTF
jgi:hypothetical protein